MDNGISGEGSVEEKQAGYLRKASFCSNFSSLMKKYKWHTLESSTEEEHKRYYGYTITGINQILEF